jgi:hypothetical protein
LFWNEFNTEKPPESKTKRSRNRNPPINHRRRKGISMPREAIQAAPSTRGEIKKSLKLEDRKFVTGKNPLNLPYSDSGSEEEKERTQDSLHIKQDENWISRHCHQSCQKNTVHRKQKLHPANLIKVKPRK